jgi:hypothetical protein
MFTPAPVAVPSILEDGVVEVPVVSILNLVLALVLPTLIVPSRGFKSAVLELVEPANLALLANTPLPSILNLIFCPSSVGVVPPVVVESEALNFRVGGKLMVPESSLDSNAPMSNRPSVAL